MPSETGVVTNDIPILPGIRNVGQLLSENGYETVYLGKLHLPIPFPRSYRGFDVIPSGKPLGEIGDTSVARGAELFLHEHDDEKPFFMVVNFDQSHDILSRVTRNYPEWEASAFEHEKQNIGEAPALPPNFRDYHGGMAGVRREQITEIEEHDEFAWRHYLWSYCRLVEGADACLGHVLKTLENTGRIDDTLIMFTADHGEGCAHHGTVMKNSLYEESIRVPLAVSYKRVLPKGAVDDEHLVSGIDIAPTIADFAGIKEDPGFTGRSLKNLLLTGDARWRQWLSVEHSSSAESKAIVTGDYKYIKMHDPKTGREREYCFDLEKDPQERENIVEDENVAETIRRLRALASQGGRQMKGAS